MTAKEHLHYVDLVRVLTVGLVIGTHILALTPVQQTVLFGALTIAFHVSREVFFLLTAFVLVYSTGLRRVRWPKFWRKRYLFVVVPYVTWTVLYFFANGGPFLGESFVTELLTGTARYHLYFLLVSMQIYLVFPLIRGLLRVTARRHGALVVVALGFQVVFSLAVQRQWTAGPLTGWLRMPDPYLPSYLGYVLIGAVAAWHRDRLIAWTRLYARQVLTGCGLVLAGGIGIYLAQVYAGGQPPLIASGVFQPAVTFESFAVAWAFLTLGLLWQERGRPAERLVRATSDASFGIYLLHPLVLQGALAVAAWTGTLALTQTGSSPPVLAVLILAVLPLIYLVSGLLTAAVRRTPVSLALTGRAWARPATPAQNRVLATTGGTR
ncbi:acyltransferase [Amycolatopsis sp. K13G38]|uniref:Acyltransferase n=1 Tax=Amycolatopsis acididurans TaxID=2724524 RepID=A0ABX1J1C6_9PSEU|nr:acyltransferase [Amycolatopsis acididurans]NKQ53595.1 acyltransferase [Amycolatopsis acididurans]